MGPRGGRGWRGRGRYYHSSSSSTYQPRLIRIKQWEREDEEDEQRGKARRPAEAAARKDENAAQRVQVVCTPGGTQRIVLADNTNLQAGATQRIVLADDTNLQAGAEETKAEANVAAEAEADVAAEAEANPTAEAEANPKVEAEANPKAEAWDEPHSRDGGEPPSRGGGENKEPNQNSGTRCKDQFRFVHRADPHAAARSTSFIPVEDGLRRLPEGQSIVDAIRGGTAFRGVRFDEILGSIFARVKPKHLSRSEYVEWLLKGVPTFPSQGVPDVGDEQNDEMFREFRSFLDERTWSSPLTAAESMFARMRENAVHVAATALNATKSELEAALHQVYRGSEHRMYNCRAVYVYTVYFDAFTFVYVGESIDVEGRINGHLVAIFVGCEHRQRGHELVRERVDDVDDVLIKLWVLFAHDEESARRMATSYVDCCAHTPTVLEVARAVAGAGFAMEAVFTAVYESLRSRSTKTRIGMNFSQPGVIHPGCDPQLTGADIASLQRQRRKARNLAPFFCDVCSSWKMNMRKYKSDDGEICDTCRSRLGKAAQPAFTCGNCEGLKPVGARRRRHAGALWCVPCHERDKQRGFVCCVCYRNVKPGAKAIRHADGLQCRKCYNEWLRNR